MFLSEFMKHFLLFFFSFFFWCAGGNGVLCERGGETSANRKRNVFFDGLHPTEALNFQIASKAYASTLEFDVYPINVRQLAQL